MPSLAGAFYICDYLEMTPSALFDLDPPNPSRLYDVFDKLKKLDDKQPETIETLINYIIRE